MAAGKGELLGFVARAALLALLAAGCDGVERYGALQPVICQAGVIGCDEGMAGLCNEDGTAWAEQELCEGRTPVCVHELGCLACEPGARRCQGNDVFRCDDSGDRWELIERCEGEAVCFGGTCDADCARAGAFRSYEGCDYWAATLMNSQLPVEFLPAVVVGNGNDEAVTVTVTRGTQFFEQLQVPADGTAALELPWSLDLKDGSPVGLSSNLSGAAFHVTSSLPVTLYQFNPLQYSLPQDCRSNDEVFGDGVCFSYSNDASLLLPVPALTEHYMVMSRPTLGLRSTLLDSDLEDHYFSPSLLAVINPQEQEVTVELTLTAPTSAGPGVLPFEAGDVATFTVAPGGVLQLATRLPTECEPEVIEPEPTTCAGGRPCRFAYCDLSELDLTGTEISASAPVAVFGAHDCDFIPFDRWACDHLEEQLFPFETWGRRFVAETSHRENDEPDLFRVLSGADDNRVSFEPPVFDPITLDRGEHIEFEADQAFEVVAEGPVLVGQFLVGQNYNFVPQEAELPPGDPAFALVVPVEQWRSSYNFLAPDSFDRSFVNLVATKESFEAVVLDGRSLAEEPWMMVGVSDFVALRLEIEPGPHALRTSGEEPFGALVYGYGQYTSYMVPGGLNLEPIALW